VGLVVGFELREEDCLQRGYLTRRSDFSLEQWGARSLAARLRQPQGICVRCLGISQQGI
jgi:hypothetical protein